MPVASSTEDKTVSEEGLRDVTYGVRRGGTAGWEGMIKPQFSPGCCTDERSQNWYA